MFPDRNRTALNPKLLVEVTSTSTEKYDRGEKLEHFKRIASLREVVIISHRERLIEVWRKAGSRWSHHQFREAAQLTSIGCSLSIADVYLDPLRG